jgi:hypothetical protein
MRRAALFLALMGWSAGLLALDPLPQVQQGPGYRTWTLEADLPLLKLEDVLMALRMDDQRNYEEALRDLGIQKVQTGPLLAWPKLVQPMEAVTQFLSSDRRKMAVLTAPIDGHHQWYAVLLRQEGNGEAYWRARQVFVFDTDPVEGYQQSFPDVLGDDQRFWQVDHLANSDIYGRLRVSSLFRWDEIGRERLTFQEAARGWHAGKFIGQAQRLKQELVYKGNQHIVRKLTLDLDPWMKREEWEHYTGVRTDEAPASKQIHLEETFAWDPADFDFYGAEQELAKLVRNKSPFIRGEAARRLGEHLKTAHPQLVAALTKDKNPLVRMQVALALAAIGDPKALPAVNKALRNVEEPDDVREALQQAQAALQSAQASAPAQPKPKRHKKPKALAAGMEPPIQPIAEPKISAQQ